MNIILKSEKFDNWLAHLRDKTAKAKIALRIGRAEQGNFGDCQPVGEGVSEMRIHHARVTVFILLAVVTLFTYCY